MPADNTTDQITIVRNPFTRLISEFIWRANVGPYITQNGFDKGFFKVLEQFTLDALRKYKINEAQYLLDKPSFIKQKKSFVFDNHLRPQHHYITNNWNIYWYEEMEIKFWPEMENKYGIISPGYQNTFVHTKIERPTVHPNPSNEFKDLFSEVYLMDCKMFGYELPF